jgi:hypothetical protein
VIRERIIVEPSGESDTIRDAKLPGQLNQVAQQFPFTANDASDMACGWHGQRPEEKVGSFERSET